MTDATRVSSLNPQQQKAVEIDSGPSVILAGAGSGKTRVLVQKVVHLVKDRSVDPKSIVMITFTNKAAAEMKERIIHALDSETSIGFAGTFHSFCAMVLRRDGAHIGIPHDFSIFDTDDQQMILKKMIKKVQTKYTPWFFASKISDAKNRLIAPEKFINVFSYYQSGLVADVYFQYQKALTQNKALDFDDLIMKVVELFREHPDVLQKYTQRYRHVLVDEFQDTNTAQYELAKLLAGTHQNITVVGDFSQSIYSWRGADIHNLERFSEDFPDAVTVHLEENYRSTQPILDFAYDVISDNQLHPILKLFTSTASGEEVEILEVANEEEEAVLICKKIHDLLQFSNYAEMVVLYRTNAQSRIIEEAFLHYGIPYLLVGGTRFYERKEIKDIISYLRLLIHPDDSVSLERVQKLGKRRFKDYSIFHKSMQGNLHMKTTDEILDGLFQYTHYLELYDQEIPEDYARLENIRELRSVAQTFPDVVQFLEQVALVESEYSEEEKKGKSKDGVRLMTLHQAKGLEFTHVFITGVEEGLLPHSRSIDDQEKLEEERRLFYVGVTRAKETLVITHARKRSIFGRRSFSEKSRFIRSEDEGEIDMW